MTTYVFPGQGSQIQGMGSTLFPDFPKLVDNANQILGYSIKTLCLDNPEERLNKTQYTQPAIYVVNALSYLKKLDENPIQPSYLAGHSLGEYNALFAAEVFDFETGLQIVKERSTLMSQVNDGGMAAIIGLKDDEVEDILATLQLSSLSIANYNSYTQTIISGPKEAINNAKSVFLNAGASSFIILNVSGPFHSPLMNSVEHAFSQYLRSFNFSSPKIPVIANVNAKPYELPEIQSNIVKQMIKPVYWKQSIEYLLNHGEVEFEEIGPGKVLSRLIARIIKGQ
jgi:malonyl CoA-acyl carrier protein transacylase